MLKNRLILFLTFSVLSSTFLLNAQDQGLEIRSRKAVFAGEEVHYSYSCLNNQNLDKTSALSLHGLPSDFKSLFLVDQIPVDHINLSPLSTVRLELTLAIPADAVSGDYPFEVHIGENSIPELIVLKKENSLTIETTRSIITALPGKRLDIPVNIRNSGSLTINNIRTSIKLPVNWNIETPMKTTDTLAPGESINSKMTLMIPSKVGPGIKKLNISVISGSQKAVEREIDIEVKQPMHILWILLSIAGVCIIFLALINRKYGRR